MVGLRSGILLAGLVLPAAVRAEIPRDVMFPTEATCYAREYSADHLASHPAQRVTSIALSPELGVADDPQLQLWVTVTVRDWPGEPLLALAYCDPFGAATLACGMEGDAGTFSVQPAQGGAVLVTVGSYGMGFEGEVGFVALEPNRGDDRSFLLQPVADCR